MAGPRHTAFLITLRSVKKIQGKSFLLTSIHCIQSKLYKIRKQQLFHHYYVVVVRKSAFYKTSFERNKNFQNTTIFTFDLNTVILFIIAGSAIGIVKLRQMNNIWRLKASLITHLLSRWLGLNFISSVPILMLWYHYLLVVGYNPSDS